MKTTGIILIVLGIFSFLGAIIASSRGENFFAGPIAFILVGAFLLSRANKKKVEEENKKKWENS